MRWTAREDEPSMSEANVAEDEGSSIVNAAWAGTAVSAAAQIAATISPDLFGAVAAVLALALFAIGCAIFLWAYALAVARSRTDEIGIGGLYFLIGTAPKVVAFRLRLALVIQVVVAIASAAIRPFTSVAFGILVPVFGLGLCGLWGARYGTFGRRGEEPEQNEQRT
jgi:hypothetical protein